MQITKVCPRCKETKTAEEFGTRTYDGRTYLKSCCRPCAVARAREHQQKKYPTKEALNEYAREYRASPSGRISWLKTKAKRRGLTGVEVDRVLEAWNDGATQCSICGEVPSDKGNMHGLSIDHCHVSLTFRGFLCSQCNTMLGHSHDNPATLRAGALYLEQHRDRV